MAHARKASQDWLNASGQRSPALLRWGLIFSSSIRFWWHSGLIWAKGSFRGAFGYNFPNSLLCKIVPVDSWPLAFIDEIQSWPKAQWISKGALYWVAHCLFVQQNWALKGPFGLKLEMDIELGNKSSLHLPEKGPSFCRNELSQPPWKGLSYSPCRCCPKRGAVEI